MRDRTVAGVVTAFSGTIALLALATCASLRITSGIRAYVIGEGLYSKAQKDAAYALARYVETGDESSFASFDKLLSVPEGDRAARLALEQRNPDMREVWRGFLKGGNNPADVPGLIFVFRYLRHTQHVEEAVRIWTEADRYIAQLRTLGNQIHDLRLKVPGNDPRITSLLQQLDAVNSRLTQLEDRFSETLSTGARSTSTTFLYGSLLLSLVLWAGGSLVTRRLLNLLAFERGRLQATINSAPLGIALIDPRKGHIAMLNAQAEVLLGPQAAHFQQAEFGSTWQAKNEQGRELTWSEYPAAKALAGETVRPQDIEWLRSDGRPIWLRVSAAPVYTDGKVSAAVVTFYDVSDERRAQEALLRQAEELARSNADLEQFAYITSHDMQEPLRNIGAFSQLLAKRLGAQLDPQTRDTIAVITAGVERMNALLRDLLSYSRVHNLNASPMTAVDLNVAVDWARSNLNASIEECKAQINVAKLPCVRGDQVQLTQVFQNLLSNAIKYRGADPLVVTIEATEQGSCHLITVADNGIGIDPRYHDRVFGLFKRLHNNTIPGTGIGLALVKRVVERHGGTISLHSTLGAGTTFQIRIPRDNA